MKILIVEDKAFMVKSLKQGLEENGMHVDVALNGLEGKKLAEENEYNVIVLDVMMPEILGTDLCKLIRESGNDVPILMISALSTLEDKITGLDSGSDDYLTKPFEFDEFLARIRALDRRRNNKFKASSIRVIDDLEINFINRSVQRNKINIDLTPKEFK